MWSRLIKQERHLRRSSPVLCARCRACAACLVNHEDHGRTCGVSSSSTLVTRRPPQEHRILCGNEVLLVSRKNQCVPCGASRPGRVLHGKCHSKRFIGVRVASVMSIGSGSMTDHACQINGRCGPLAHIRLQLRAGRGRAAACSTEGGGGHNLLLPSAFSLHFCGRGLIQEAIC